MTVSEYEAHLEARVAEELAGRDELPPPWAVYPEFPHGSAAWRQGVGEDWLALWMHWTKSLPPARAARAQYLRRFPPAPARWLKLVADVLVGAERRRKDRDPQEEAYGLGLVQPDAAYGAWRRMAGEPPAPPWEWEPGATPADLMRRRTRGLGFWTRWAAENRRGGLAIGEEPGEWGRFVHALLEAKVPSWVGFRVYDTWEKHALVLAAHGELPPPWERGERVRDLHRKLPEEPSYADAWATWVPLAFDDDESWQAYLERHGAPPPEWEKVVRLRFRFPAATLRHARFRRR